MPDFHPISEVINLFFSPPFQPCLSLLIRIFCHFLQDTVPAPLARTISYNIAGPISAFGISISHLGSTDVQICHIRPNSHQFSL
jgi:hypothetical protein